MSGFSGRLQADYGTPGQPNYRFLPQGGFQSVNATVSAQNQCRIPSPDEQTETDTYRVNRNEKNAKETKTNQVKNAEQANVSQGNVLHQLASDDW